MNKICPTCKQTTMIKIAEYHSQNLYSCHNENCSDYGELFVIGIDDFIKIDKLVEKLMDVINE